MEEKLYDMSTLKFYIDSNSALKKKGLEIALADMGLEAEIIIEIPSVPIDVRPMKRLEIIHTTYERAGLLLPNHREDYDYVLGLQKGNTLLDLTEPFLIEAHAVIKHQNSGHYGISRSIQLPDEIRRNVRNGMDLYDAYEEVFGSEVRNKEWSIIEALTGIPEEKILSKPIKGCLECFFGVGSKFYHHS